MNRERASKAVCRYVVQISVYLPQAIPDAIELPVLYITGDWDTTGLWLAPRSQIDRILAE